jgi:hypothetical protein
MPFFQAWKKYFFRYVETWVGVSVVVFLLGALCLGIPLLLETTSDLEFAPALLIAGAFSFMAIVFGGTGVYVFAVLRQRRAQLDAAFGMPGLAGRGYTFSGRQYHGLFGDRQVDGYYFQGPTLELYVSAALTTRFGIGPRNALGTLIANIANRTPLALDDAAFQKWDAYADDPAWATGWLAEAEVKSALTRLLVSANDAEWRTLTIQPGSVRWLLRYTEESCITPEAVRRWLEDLVVAAAAAERRAPPAVPSAPLSALERTSQENRGAFTLPAFLLVVGLLLIPTICLVAALIVLVTLPGAG